MNDLTLDVCILMAGSGIGNKQYRDACRDLMRKMISDANSYLALDERKKIEVQYLQKLKEGTLGHHFVKQMASHGKTVTVPWQNLNRGIAVKLKQKGFTANNEDYKFVVVASGTCCKKLVSHDPHFFNVQYILKQIHIAVLYPDQV